MDLPLDRQRSPPLQWVQTRVPGAKELVLQTHWKQETLASAKRVHAGAEGALQRSDGRRAVMRKTQQAAEVGFQDRRVLELVPHT